MDQIGPIIIAIIVVVVVVGVGVNIGNEGCIAAVIVVAVTDIGICTCNIQVELSVLWIGLQVVLQSLTGFSYERRGRCKGSRGC